MLHPVNEVCQESLKEAISFAKKMNLGHQFCRQLEWLSRYGQTPEKFLEQTVRCCLYKDFAPFSFEFVMQKKDSKGEWGRWFNGGLIYQGPGLPADGSFPTLTVSLHNQTGWFVHT